MENKKISTKFLLIAVGAIIAVFALLGFQYYGFSAAGISDTESGNIIPLDTLPTYISNDSGASGQKVEALKETYNILAIGVDQTEEGDKYPRSDVNMIISIDPVSNKIKISSLLRDCYVDIPGHGNNRLNAAFSLGGPSLLMETVNINFDMKIDKYVYVNFDTFVEVIDILDGVTINLLEEETSHVFGETKDAGTYTLNGNQALDYARIRKIDTDFHRTSRQRDVIFAVYEDVVDQSEDKLLELFYKIYPLVNTNLKVPEMITIFYQYLQMDEVGIGEMYFPADGTFEETTINGQDVLNIDLEKNQVLLNNFIYKDEEQEQLLTK